MRSPQHIASWPSHVTPTTSHTLELCFSSCFGQHRDCAKYLNKPLTSFLSPMLALKRLEHSCKEMSTGLRVWDSGLKFWF